MTSGSGTWGSFWVMGMMWAPMVLLAQRPPGTSAYSDVFPLLRRAFFDRYRIKKMPDVEICYNGKALHGPCGLAAQSSTALTTLFELGVVCRRRISNPEPVGQS